MEINRNILKPFHFIVPKLKKIFFYYLRCDDNTYNYETKFPIEKKVE